jgi:hypothetical protein
MASCISPDCSVVVASFSGPAALERCLLSLEQGAAGAEVIVATNACASLLKPLEARFPGVQFIACHSDCTVFTLRSRGVLAAQRQLIILTEDHCTVGPDWLAALTAASKMGHVVVGGPIANGLTSRARHWAIYLSEYATYAPPLSAGEVATLLAANTAYDRSALLDCQAVWRDGFFDNEVHDALKAAGYILYIEPQAVVESHLDFSLSSAVAHLYAGGQRFGAYRISGASPLQKLLWKVAVPGVPLVLMARLLRSLILRRLMGVAMLLRSLPYCLLLCLAWASGEARGYFSEKLLTTKAD